MNPLQEQVALVARMRARRAAASAAFHELRQEFVRSNAAAISMAELADQDLVAAETKLREMTLAAYAETGDKNPASGVAVQLRQRLHYDVDEAIRWGAFSGHLSVLSLKRTEFEKAAKNLHRSGRSFALSFVTMTEEPTPTIATDLSPFAKEPPAEAGGEMPELPF